MFIYVVEEVPRFLGALQPVMRAVRQGDLAAVTSELTLAEVLVHPFRDADLERERSFTRALRTHGGLAVVPVSRAALVEAARLRSAYPELRLPDALHAATARRHDCPVFPTNDLRVPDLPGLEVILLSEVA